MPPKKKPQATLKRPSPKKDDKASKTGGKNSAVNKFRPMATRIAQSLEILSTDPPLLSSIQSFRLLVPTTDPPQLAITLIHLLKDLLLKPSPTSVTLECLEYLWKVVSCGQVSRTSCSEEVLGTLFGMLVDGKENSVCRKVCTMLNWLLSKKDFDALIADPSTTLSKLVTVMRTCEDIELQQALVELLFRVSPRGDKERQEFASTYQIPLQFTKIALDNFVDDVREFLGALNESNEAGKRWPKSYRVSVVAYGGNPKCECKPISTFWLDFLKTGILVHFELNGDIAIVEIEYDTIINFDVTYEGISLMLKKPVSVFTSTGKTKPPYTLSLLWKPKNFPARGPFSIRTILNQNGVRELPSSAAYDTQREKVSVPFSRRTFSSVSIIVPNAEEGDKTLVDEMVHPPETSSPHSHVQREAPVQEPAETEINSRSPQSNVEEPAQKPHEVVPRPNPVAQDVVNCEVSTQHDDIAPRKRGRPRSKPHPPQKAQSPPFQLVRPKRTRAPKPVYKDTWDDDEDVRNEGKDANMDDNRGMSDVSERKDAEEMGEKFSDADDADQRHDKPTRKSTQRLQEDDNEAMETVKRRARKPAIHAHEDDEDGIEFNKPHTLRLVDKQRARKSTKTLRKDFSDDEEELEVDGPCRQRVDNEHICKPAKHADDDDEKDTTIPKPRSNRRVNQQRLGKSTKHLYKEDEGPMEVDKKRHSDDQRSRKEMKTLHQDLSDESEEMEVDRYPHHRRVGGDRARKPAKLLHEDDEDIQVDTRVRKSVKRVFEVDEEIESLMEHQPRELCEHIPDRDKLKNPPRSTRTSAFGEKDNVLSLYSAPRSTHHESIPISSPAADRATFCTFKDDEIAAVEGVFDGMKKVFLAQVHHKRTQAITSHLTHLSKRQKTHLELLHETVPVWRDEDGIWTEDERGMSMEVVDEVLKKHEPACRKAIADMLCCRIEF